MVRKKDDEWVTEPMLVTRRKGSRYSNSHTRPGEFSPLTRDEQDELGQVTLRRIESKQTSTAAQQEPGPGQVPEWNQDWSPQRTREQEEWDEFVRTVIRGLLALAIERGKPHVKRLWTEKIRPSVQDRAHRVFDGRALRRRARDEQGTPVQALTDEPLRLPSTRVDQLVPSMTDGEAQAGILAALLEGRLSDKQRVAEAAVHDEGREDLVRALSQVPPAQVVTLAIQNPQQNNGLLTGLQTADCASLLAAVIRTPTVQR